MKLFDLLQLPEIRCLPAKSQLAIVGIAQLIETRGHEPKLTDAQLRNAPGVDLKPHAWRQLLGALVAVGAASLIDGVCAFNADFFGQAAGHVPRKRYPSDEKRAQRRRSESASTPAPTPEQLPAIEQPVAAARPRVVNAPSAISDESRAAIRARGWTDEEIDEGLAILAERKVPPRSPAGVLLAGLLAEVRAGRRAARQQAMPMLAVAANKAPIPVAVAPRGFTDERARRVLGLPRDFQPASNALDAIAAGLQKARAAV